MGQAARGAGQGSAGYQMGGWHTGLLLRKEKQISLVLFFVRSEAGLSWMGLLDWLLRRKEDREKQGRYRGGGKEWEKKNEESKRQCRA